MRDYTILIPFATLFFILFGLVHGIRWAYLESKARRQTAEPDKTARGETGGRAA